MVFVDSAVFLDSPIDRFSAGVIARDSDTRGFWRMNESGGSRVADLTANANHGTADANARILDGRVGKCRRYDTSISAGVVEMVSIPDSSTLNFGSSTDFTIKFWMRMGSGGVSPNIQLLVTKTVNLNGGGVAGGYEVGIFPDGTGMRIQAHDQTNSITYSFTTTNQLLPYVLNDGIWHYIIATFDRANDEIRLQVDSNAARLGGGFGSVGNVDSTKTLRFGSFQTGLPTFAEIDEIIIMQSIDRTTPFGNFIDRF